MSEPDEQYHSFIRRNENDGEDQGLDQLRDWSALLFNVQEQITYHLAGADRVQARGVCSEWRDVLSFVTHAVLANAVNPSVHTPAMLAQLVRAYPRIERLLLNTGTDAEALSDLTRSIQELLPCETLHELELRAVPAPQTNSSSPRPSHHMPHFVASEDTVHAAGPGAPSPTSAMPGLYSYMHTAPLPDAFSTLFEQLASLTQLRRLKLHYQGAWKVNTTDPHAGQGNGQYPDEGDSEMEDVHPTLSSSPPGLYRMDPAQLSMLSRLRNLQELELAVDFFRTSVPASHLQDPAGVLSGMSALTSLKLHGELEGVEVAFLGGLPQLRNLELHGLDDHEPAALGALQGALEQLGNLESLSLTLSKMCRHFLSSVGSLSRLSSLYLQYLDLGGGVGAMAGTASWLQYFRGWSEFRNAFTVQLSALTGLEIDGFCMDGSTLAVLASMTGLRQLVLREVSPPLAAHDADDVLTLLAPLRKMERFCLEVVAEAVVQYGEFHTRTLRLMPETVQVLGEAWPLLHTFHYEGDCGGIHPYRRSFTFMPSLSALYLTHQHPAGAPRSEYSPCLFATCLPPGLTSLHLEGFTVRAQELRALGPRCTHLSHLALLDYFQLSDDHLAALAAGLPGLHSLTLEARLGHGSVTEPALAQMVCKMTALRSLWLMLPELERPLGLVPLRSLPALTSLSLQLPAPAITAGHLSWLTTLTSLKWLGLSPFVQADADLEPFSLELVAIQQLLPWCAVQAVRPSGVMVAKPRTSFTRHMDESSRFRPYSGVERYSKYGWILEGAQ